MRSIRAIAVVFAVTGSALCACDKRERRATADDSAEQARQLRVAFAPHLADKIQDIKNDEGVTAKTEGANDDVLRVDASRCLDITELADDVSIRRVLREHGFKFVRCVQYGREIWKRSI